MKDFDSLIFDLDGTLWDTCEACAVAWNNVVNRNEIKFRQVTASDVRSVTGKPHAECIKTVFSSLSNEEISILIDETMIEDTVAIKELGGELYEGVSEGFHRPLKAGTSNHRKAPGVAGIMAEDPQG